MPKTVDEAFKLDKETGTTFWTDALAKEMKNVRPAFKAWDGTLAEALSGKKLVGYQKINCHMIFDIKMDGKFTRKCRFVAGGHTTDPPSSSTYSSVVSRDSVCIAFLIAAMNGWFAGCVGGRHLQETIPFAQCPELSRNEISTY